MKINKTPGIDGIRNIAIEAAIESSTELFRQIFDVCLQERMSPRILKRQRLVFISKDNNAHDSTGYRPLCMVDAAGKLLEGTGIKPA